MELSELLMIILLKVFVGYVGDSVSAQGNAELEASIERQKEESGLGG